MSCHGKYTREKNLIVTDPDLVTEFQMFGSGPGQFQPGSAALVPFPECKIKKSFFKANTL